MSRLLCCLLSYVLWCCVILSVVWLIFPIDFRFCCLFKLCIGFLCSYTCSTHHQHRRPAELSYLSERLIFLHLFSCFRHWLIWNSSVNWLCIRTQASIFVSVVWISLIHFERIPKSSRMLVNCCRLMESDAWRTSINILYMSISYSHVLCSICLTVKFWSIVDLPFLKPASYWPLHRL